MVNNTILTYSCTHSYVTTTLSWDIDYGTVSNNVPATSPCLSEVKTTLIHKKLLMTHLPLAPSLSRQDKTNSAQQAHARHYSMHFQIQYQWYYSLPAHSHIAAVLHVHCFFQKVLCIFVSFGFCCGQVHDLIQKCSHCVCFGRWCHPQLCAAEFRVALWNYL